ncbi:unnamed protein product [Camellia sinensis]
MIEDTEPLVESPPPPHRRLVSDQIRSLNSDPKMNDADVSKQIQQMVRFIRQEAEEKANEISVSAEEEFNIEKLQLVEAEKKKIRQEYERKEKQVEVRRKILLRLKEPAVLLRCRKEDLNHVEHVVHSAREEYADKAKVHAPEIVVDSIYLPAAPSHHNAHGPFCSGGVVLASRDGKIVFENSLDARLDVVFRKKPPESLLRLKEPAVLLRCRKEDLNHVEHVVHSAKEEYADKAKVHAPEIVVDSIYLPAAPSHHNAHGPFCSGGVVLASRDGKIVFENSLNARLDVVFRKKLPEMPAIRKQLFGQVAV